MDSWQKGLIRIRTVKLNDKTYAVCHKCGIFVPLVEAINDNLKCHHCGEKMYFKLGDEDA